MMVLCYTLLGLGRARSTRAAHPTTHSTELRPHHITAGFANRDCHIECGGERVSKELVALRGRALEETSNEAIARERELRELQVELEHCRIQRDEWEREALEGRVKLDEAKTTAENLKRDLRLRDS